MRVQLKNKRNGVIDQLLLWIVLFLGFVGLFFMVIDYSALMRLKGYNDTLAQYGARMISLGHSTDEVATSLNNIRNSYYGVIDGSDIVCDEVDTSSFQVIFKVLSTYEDAKVLSINETINSRFVAFNEINGNEITCTLTMSNN